MKPDTIPFKFRNIKEVPKRIVFQLDVSLDTLHYCIWTNAINEERNSGAIRDFRKALHQCKIIHPDDVHVFEQFIQKKTDLTAEVNADIRLFTGAANYAWYRILIVAPENQQTQMHIISGVLESLQSMQDSVRRKQERLTQDTLFRKAVTSSSIISLNFDCSTGERLISNHDTLPSWLPESIRLKDIVQMLRKQVISPEKPYGLDDLLISQNSLADRYGQKPFYRDCKLVDLTKETGELRWYRIYHAFMKETRASSACFYLTVMDIHEDKMRERSLEEKIIYDNTTGMLRRCAFEHQVTAWLEQIRSEAPYSYVCSVVMIIDHAVDIMAQQGRDYVSKRVQMLGKTINAFIHSNEICGRYGFARFAMVLFSTSMDIIHERLNMLQMICRSLNSEWPDLQLRFGSNLELATQTEQGDVLLEKACQMLFREKSNDIPKAMPSSGDGHVTATSHSDDTSVVGRPQEALPTSRMQHIFIRTFGHFDVFVDGEAVLFNHSKAKELLALLVDRRGGFVGATEAISCLWEDEPANNTTLSRCRKAALHLREILTKYGIEHLIETVNGKRRILMGFCDCDYYQYLQQGTDSANKILGSYLNEYSWAENSIAHEQ